MASPTTTAIPKPLVVLTGLTGFVGAHVFDTLLSSGYRVLGVVRSPTKAHFLADKYQLQAADFSFITIPDLQQESQALDDAIANADYVCHLASPCHFTATDPIAELVEPAIQNTHTLMSTAIRCSCTLKRLVILSSFAAVRDKREDPRPGYLYTAKDWNPITNEEDIAANGIAAYSAGKTLAERAAWDMWQEAKPSWDLVTLCPPNIYGPVIHSVDRSQGIDGLNWTVKKLITSLMGREPPFAPKVATPVLPAWVDVRDVALAHVRALQLPAGVSERILVAAGTAFFEDGLGRLREKGEMGLGEEGERCDSTDWYRLDLGPLQSLLGLELTPFTKSVEDSWAKVKELGLVT